jgi:hypothetical protein
MRLRSNPGHDRLPAALRPAPVTLRLPTTNHVEAAERELVRHAQADEHTCWGYFPSLAGRQGIHTDLPACSQFAVTVPVVTAAGMDYHFNFIRLSLSRQGQQPAYHLDSDAATALTGDPATLDHRQVGRILLNLSSKQERNLYYLDLDPKAIVLTREGSYVRAADQAIGTGRTVCAAIPPRSGTTVHGVRFIANRVLHSGTDGPAGHFVAAYGYDTALPLAGTVSTSQDLPAESEAEVHGQL